MPENSFEIDLIESIQRSALDRIEKLQEALDKEDVLNFLDGKKLIEEYLWKDELLVETVYGLIADGLAKATIYWKEVHKESSLSNLAIWISYNSKLADPNWQTPTRVATENFRDKSFSYVCEDPSKNGAHFSKDLIKGDRQLPIVSKGRDLVSIWFEVLKNEFQAVGSSIGPSMHYYLSTFAPYFKGTSDQIRTATFFSVEDFKDSSIKRRVNQENDFLLRNRSTNDLYVPMRRGASVEEIHGILHKRLFEDVSFKSGEKMVSLPDFLDEVSAKEWSKRYAAFLCGLILSDEPKEIRKFSEQEENVDFKTSLENALFEEGKVKLKNKNHPQQYKCITNIYVDVPGSERNLGSVIIFSDKLINPALTKAGLFCTVGSICPPSRIGRKCHREKYVQKTYCPLGDRRDHE